MAQAPIFNPPYNFNDKTSVDPSELQTTIMEAANTINQNRNNLSCIMNDDKTLKSGIVTPSSIDPELITILTENRVDVGLWSSGMQYQSGTVFQSGLDRYYVIQSHVSTTISQDEADKKIFDLSKVNLPTDGVPVLFSSGGNNAYQITTRNQDGYTDGEIWLMVANHNSTGAVTVNRNSLGEKPLRRGSTNFSYGEIVEGEIYLIKYSQANNEFNVLSGISSNNQGFGVSGLQITSDSNRTFRVQAKKAVLINSTTKLTVEHENISLWGTPHGNPTSLSFTKPMFIDVSGQAGDLTWYDLYIVSDSNAATLILLNEGDNYANSASYSTNPYSLYVGKIFYVDQSNILRITQRGGKVNIIDEQLSRTSLGEYSDPFIWTVEGNTRVAKRAIPINYPKSIDYATFFYEVENSADLSQDTYLYGEAIYALPLTPFDKQNYEKIKKIKLGSNLTYSGSHELTVGENSRGLSMSFGVLTQPTGLFLDVFLSGFKLQSIKEL